MSSEFAIGVVIGITVLQSGLLSTIMGIIIGMYMSQCGITFDKISDILQPYLLIAKDLARERLFG